MQHGFLHLCQWPNGAVQLNPTTETHASGQRAGSVAVSIALACTDSDKSSEEGSRRVERFQAGSAQNRPERSIRFSEHSQCSEGPKAAESLMRRLAEASDSESDEFVHHGEDHSVRAAHPPSRQAQASHSAYGQPHGVAESSDRRTRARLRQAAVAAIVDTPEPSDGISQSHPAGSTHAHDSGQQSLGCQPRLPVNQHLTVPSSALRPAQLGAMMTTECTNVFQNDLFQGNQVLSSAAATSIHGAAAGTGSDARAEAASADTSQRYAMKAAVRIRAGLKAVHESPEHAHLREAGTDVPAYTSTPFYVHIGCTDGARKNGPNLGPILFPTTADVHTNVLTAEHDTHCSSFSPPQASILRSNPVDSFGSIFAHDRPVLSCLTNAVQLAFQINPAIFPEQLALTLAPIKEQQVKMRSSCSVTASSISAPGTDWVVTSKFASGKYVPSVHALPVDVAYSGASRQYRSAAVASSGTGSSRWAVVKPIPTFNSTSYSRSFASHDPEPVSTCADNTGLENVDMLLQGPASSKALQGWRSSFAKAALPRLSEKQPAAHLLSTLKARKIALEAAECMQLLEASDHGRNALSAITDDPDYLKTLRASVEADDSMPQGRSFGIFPPSWPLRRAVHTLVEHPRFDNFMFLCIAVSCASPTCSAPVHPA